MLPSITRRRAIGITAAAAGLSLISGGSVARATGQLVEWRGSAMGAVATLRIHHHDRAAAERLIGRAITEMQRLERVFSLYRDDSALVRLNRQGMLIAPPIELVSLLAECRTYYELTGAAFDPTVQSVWTLFREHFAVGNADPSGPSDAALAERLTKVGFPHVTFDMDRIVFARRGMALTLNGIAQGYITDRVVQMLRLEGIDRSLVDMGEPRAMGPRPDGSPWRVGVAKPENPDEVGRTFDVVDKAVATSGAYGFRFDREGRFHHLIDPRTGRPGEKYRSVTVVMPTATAADALSTAFSLMNSEEITKIGEVLGVDDIYATTSAGQTVSFGG
ncbi:FAD:protein FMN transferase [Microvirga brassicacearum]|uniref:FAD:protein FMN transferase n=1 Tax=Microvirga brassicacearum TaxID=2580413 RepID=A0A5N3PAP4_9HYPH|nr:FAD:protein FMN transferase [Microvirga brassicacearum]KAB0266826.1 FAD:protein FMN transferase [Microvirga brassicacearum]